MIDQRPNSSLVPNGKLFPASSSLSETPGYDEHHPHSVVQQIDEDLPLGRVAISRRLRERIRRTDRSHAQRFTLEERTHEEDANEDHSQFSKSQAPHQTDVNSKDLVSVLHRFHQIAPSWISWEPHYATLLALDLVLRRLASGRMIRPAPPADNASQGVEMHEDEEDPNTALAVLRRIYRNYPNAVRTVSAKGAQIQRREESME
jgi:hypothetical protein